jgi:hypothetical protein
MAECPHCEYNKQRAHNWRTEAYRLAGHPLPERDPVLEEREACALICDAVTQDMSLGPLEKYRAAEIAKLIRARGQV